MHRVLAAHGRRESACDGQMATVHETRRESWREEYKLARRECDVAELDRFWDRSHCEECVRRKKSCSLDESIWKEMVPEE